MVWYIAFSWVPRVLLADPAKALSVTYVVYSSRTCKYPHAGSTQRLVRGWRKSCSRQPILSGAADHEHPRFQLARACDRWSWIHRHASGAQTSRENECIVTVLDNFHGQIHSRPALAEDIAERVRLLIVASVTDRSAVAESLANQDVVVHLAAETGTGQSMYAIERYERVNGVGTAILLDCLTNHPARTVTKIVVASSRAIYGEGKVYAALNTVRFSPSGRSASRDVAGAVRARLPCVLTTMSPVAD